MRATANVLRTAFHLIVFMTVATSTLAIRREPRIENLEILRTDPATVRTASGQWQLTNTNPHLDAFHGEYGEAWSVRWNELTQTPHRAYGGRLAPERIDAALRVAGPRDKDAILRLSEAFVRANRALLGGAAWEDLRPVFVDIKGGRWVVTLQQEARGVEVVGGRVDLRFSERGELMLFGADIYPVPDLENSPTPAMPRILSAARDGLPVPEGATPPDDAELVLLPMLAGEPLPAGVRKTAPRGQVTPSDLSVRPAYRVRVRTEDPPGDWVNYVDAGTARVLWRYNRVRFASVTGTVTGDFRPITGNDTPVTVAYPDARVWGGVATSTVVSYDFESGNQGWSGQSPWARSSESVHSGTQAWSDSPGNSYSNNRNITLTSPTIDISAVIDPALVFWTRVQTEDTWDFLYVEASGDGGGTWQILGALTGSQAWHEETFDLSAVQGTSTLRVRFRFWSDTSVTDDGAWVDDVSVVSRGSALTDANGDYGVETTGGDDTITALLKGPIIHLQNKAGADGSVSGLPAGGVFDVDWNDGNSTSAERDMFVATNVVHEWLKNVDSGFTALDYPLPVFVGIPFCNAYWAGSQIVMGAGSAGCSDLANWPPVMYHEYGHGITDFLYEPISDPPGDMHEGFSDYIMATLTDDPRVGPDIVGAGTMFRTIDNHLRDPEDRAGEVHIDGTIIAGALWDMRELLGDVALADSLFHFARYGFPMNFEDYFTELLTVDDDDGDLGNGTPHIETIRSAFGFHGIGLGPEFEHASVVVQDGAFGNGDARLDPGERAGLVLTLHNYGVAESNVYAKISTSTPGVSVTVDSVAIGGVPADSDVTAPVPFEVQVDDTVSVGTAIVFELEMHSDVGFNIDRFMLSAGYVPILLVDDDRTRVLETYYMDALDAAGKRFTRWQAGILGGPSAEEMADYRAVIWFTGNDRTTTLAAGDQVELATYLGGGGNLFITGEDIGEDLWFGNQTNPTPGDIAFYETWLHAEVDVENEGGPPIVGETGDVIGDGLAFTLNGGSSANNQSSVSSLVPLSGAVPALRYDNGRVAALRFDGGYRLFYCGFGFEGITDQAQRDLLMTRAMSWLCPDEAVPPTVTVVEPNGGEIIAGFFPVTTVRWTAHDATAVVSVDLLLSTDGGSNFTPIATDIPNSFTFEWDVPIVNSDQCLVRVEATDPSSNVGFDTSDAVFTIDFQTPELVNRFASVDDPVSDLTSTPIAEWEFGIVSCTDGGWDTAGGTWARTFHHITDNDVCYENTTCAWLFTDHTTPTSATDPSMTFAPDGYVLADGIWDVVISPWVSLASTPGQATDLSYRVFPGNFFDFSRFAMNWSVRTRTISGPDTLVADWEHDEWTTLDLFDWVRISEDLTLRVDSSAQDLQVRFQVADWGPSGLGLSSLPTPYVPGPGPFFDAVRIGRTALSGPYISEGIDSRSQAQDAFPTEIDPTVTPAGEHHRPTTDRFGVAAFSRAGDLGTGGTTPNLITGDSIHVQVVDVRNAGGLTSVEWYGAIVSGPHEGKAPPPWTVQMQGFFVVPADSSRDPGSGQIVENSFFVDLDDDYFRGGDVLQYLWLAEDASGGFASHPAGLQSAPSSVDNAAAQTGGLLEVSFLPAIAWDAGYLTRIANDTHGKLDPTPEELAASSQANCILYVHAHAPWRRSGDGNRTAFMYTLDAMGYRGSYDVYDTQGFWNLNSHLGGRATIQQAEGYNLIVYDAGNLAPYGTIVPNGTDLDRGKIDQASWFRNWLAQASTSAAGFATLWVMGSNFLEDDPTNSLYSADMEVALNATDQAMNANPDVQGQASFTFDQGAGNSLQDFTGDEFSLEGGCPLQRDYDALAAMGSAVETHVYADPVFGGVGDAAVVMKTDAANDWNTIAQSHPWGDIRDLFGGGPPDSLTSRKMLLGKILQGTLPVGCQEAEDPTDTGRPDELDVPVVTALRQNIPNPFNPTTRIEFDLAHDGHVSLKIYDVAGRLVRTLVDATLTRGRYTGEKAPVWDGFDHTGRRVSSGVYFYRLDAPDFSRAMKMVVMK